MIGIIILDFDGVILESVSVKTEAFRKLFSFAPEHIDEIIQYHKENGGMSRYDKFRHIYKSILRQDLPKQKFKELSETFADLVFEEMIKTPFVPGAHDFLEKYYTTMTLYIVSATPEEELIRIIRARKISHYFRRVYGAPRKKADCIREIIKYTGPYPDSVIFVGDAKNDFEAAQAIGVRFIGRIKPGDENRFLGLSGIDALIPDLHELARYIEVNS